MGLLDEAIREHLELKRRHGADPSEVARLEHEALGDERREVALAEVDDAVPAHAPEPEAAASPYERPAADPQPAIAPEPATAAEVEQPTRQFDTSASEIGLEAPPVEPEPGEPADEPARADEIEPAGEIVPADEVVPPDEEIDSEDVLEETPEFLQETPEHDRLWFEQKPPRDFDF